MRDSESTSKIKVRSPGTFSKTLLNVSNYLHFKSISWKLDSTIASLGLNLYKFGNIVRKLVKQDF